MNSKWADDNKTGIAILVVTGFILVSLAVGLAFGAAAGCATGGAFCFITVIGGLKK